MSKLYLFTDGSVNTRTKVGFGAYLILTDLESPFDKLKTLVKVKRFEQTSSTKLELQTLLWVLNEIDTIENEIIVYTDSQNIVGLTTRREYLEKNNYISGKGKKLNNYKLYQEFYRLNDNLNCQFIKIQGHKATKYKGELDKIFTLVDRASRNALRREN